MPGPYAGPLGSHTESRGHRVMPAALGCQILKRVADQGRERELREIPLETDKMDIWIQLKPLPACQSPGQGLLWQ